MTCPNCKQDHIIERNATTMLCMLCGWKGPLPRPAWIDAAANQLIDIIGLSDDGTGLIGDIIERHWRESTKGTP